MKKLRGMVVYNNIDLQDRLTAFCIFSDGIKVPYNSRPICRIWKRSNSMQVNLPEKIQWLNLYAFEGRVVKYYDDLDRVCCIGD